MLREYIPYTLLPSDVEDHSGSNARPGSRKSRIISRILRLSYRLKLVLFLLIPVVTLLLVIVIQKTKSRRPIWNGPIYSFDKEPRPAWMTVVTESPVKTPLSLRVAVLSHPKEVERRELIREYMFKGVPRNEVHIDHCFLVGKPSGWSAQGKLEKLLQEQEEHQDLVILDIEDSKKRLSQKRYSGLKWAKSFSNASYDYLMMMDSDTFVRFGALARRLPTILDEKNINPREQPVMIARMSPHSRYWLTTVLPEDEGTIVGEDMHFNGPTYSYPIGIGHMLSSSLVNTLLSTRYTLPHHIFYPYDDVMIGSWIASLKYFPDQSVNFSAPQGLGGQPFGFHPDPLYPYPIDTTLINDYWGWHDYPGRAYLADINGAIGWNSVCIHHIKDSEIKMLREMKEFQGEWE